MNLMLVAIFAAVGVGLVSKDFGRRTSNFSWGLAVLLTVIYFLRPQYMT